MLKKISIQLKHTHKEYNANALRIY